MSKIIRISEKMDFGISEILAENEVAAEISDNLLDLEIDEMGRMVHEFGHMIYIQESYIKKSLRRDRGKEESAKHDKNKNYMTENNRWNDYFSLDTEILARLWQLKFLNHYFPHSKYVNEVKEELKRGRSGRLERDLRKNKKTSSKDL